MTIEELISTYGSGIGNICSEYITTDTTYSGGGSYGLQATVIDGTTYYCTYVSAFCDTGDTGKMYMDAFCSEVLHKTYTKNCYYDSAGTNLYSSNDYYITNCVYGEVSYQAIFGTGTAYQTVLYQTKL